MTFGPLTHEVLKAAFKEEIMRNTVEVNGVVLTREQVEGAMRKLNTPKFVPPEPGRVFVFGAGRNVFLRLHGTEENKLRKVGLPCSGAACRSNSLIVVQLTGASYERGSISWFDGNEPFEYAYVDLPEPK